MNFIFYNTAIVFIKYIFIGVLNSKVGFNFRNNRLRSALAQLEKHF